MTFELQRALDMYNFAKEALHNVICCFRGDADYKRRVLCKDSKEYWLIAESQSDSDQAGLAYLWSRNVTALGAMGMSLQSLGDDKLCILATPEHVLNPKLAPRVRESLLRTADGIMHLLGCKIKEVNNAART